MSDKTKILQDFKKNLLSFVIELINLIPNCGEFVLARAALETDKIPVIEVMKYFVEIMLPMENQIKSRSDSVILENKIFRQVDPNGRIKEIWCQFDADDKETFWNWVDFFLGMTKKYATTN